MNRARKASNKRRARAEFHKRRRDDAVGKSQQIIGRVALSTYQGFAGALQTWTSQFMPRLQIRLHELTEGIGGPHVRVGRWLPLAIDGSRATTPRTKSNEKAFCAKNYGKGKTAKYRKNKESSYADERIG